MSSVQAIRGLFTFFYTSGEKGADAAGLKGSPGAAVYLRNVLAPALVCLEGSCGAECALSPAAAAARREVYLTGLPLCVSSGESIPRLILPEVGLFVGSILGGKMREGLAVLNPSYANAAAVEPLLDLPADLHLLYTFGTEVCEEDGKRRAKDWIPENPYVGPIYLKRSCRACGILPLHEDDKAFQVCSLCNDPAAGRFCSRDPCFVAFWKGGHKKECSGRDKIKELKGEK
jgi:hypothetical protein